MIILTLEIVPKKGLGEIHFGDTSDDVIKILGEPEDIENIEDVDGFNTVILYYWEQGLTVFFEGREKSVIACIETENADSLMFGKEIFKMTEEDIIALMSTKGYHLEEVEMETTGERRVSYDDALMDFFFEGGHLIAVNWGVLVNEKGEIEEL
jgi:hypothetical protein